MITLVSSKMVRLSAQLAVGLRSLAPALQQNCHRNPESSMKQIILAHDKDRDTQITKSMTPEKGHDPSKGRGQQRKRKRQQRSNHQTNNQPNQRSK